MDQIKIGKFIAQMRKKCNLTQRQLAEQLCISDKTVSKWECGKGLPEVSLMLPLCECLGISVNELLTGQQLDDSEYKSKAEDNIMKLMNERQENKKKMLLGIAVMFVTLIASMTLILVSGLAQMDEPVRIILLIIGLVVMAGGLCVAIILDVDSSVFECPKCGARFVPSTKEYVMGVHTLTRRHLRCPECGKKSMCIRRLSHKDEGEQ